MYKSNNFLIFIFPKLFVLSPSTRIRIETVIGLISKSPLSREGTASRILLSRGRDGAPTHPPSGRCRYARYIEKYTASTASNSCR